MVSRHGRVSPAHGDVAKLARRRIIEFPCEMACAAIRPQRAKDSKDPVHRSSPRWQCSTDRREGSRGTESRSAGDEAKSRPGLAESREERESVKPLPRAVTGRRGTT